MAKYHIENTIRASSSAFQWGQLVFTDYQTGCLRKILVQSQAYEASIDPKYALIGEMNEERHEERLVNQGLRKDVDFVRERNFVQLVPSYPTVQLSGHVDFTYLSASGVPYQIDELKSMTSDRVYRNVIKSGIWKTENLAQTVAYMVAMRVARARLIYTFYKEAKKVPADAVITDRYKVADERIFVVELDDFGRIHVDSKPTKYTVQDQLAHQHAAAMAVYEKRVLQRPVNADASFGSPCEYCPFKRACDAYDSGILESSAAFVQSCQTIVKEKISA